jgi:CheY-like chemotaxis protein
VSQPSDKPEPGSAHVLVAEDDIIAQLVAKKIIEQAGYTVDVVEDGQKAIDALKSAHYDLVLMDCLMPEMNGFEASQTIRNTDDPDIDSSIPIIAMTGLTKEEDQQRCIDAGMFEVISKPFSSEDLLPVIRHCIARAEQTDNAIDQADETEKQTWDDSFIDDVIERYLSEVPRVIEELQQAVDEADARKLRQVSHRFRGATDFLQVTGLSARSRVLEEAAEAGETELAITHATELIGALQKLMHMLSE